MSTRARIESAARLHGWSIHFGGWRTIKGVTLTRGQESIRVDLDTHRNRVLRAAQLRDGKLVLEVNPQDREKLRTVVRLIERASR